MNEQTEKQTHTLTCASCLFIKNDGGIKSRGNISGVTGKLKGKNILLK